MTSHNAEIIFFIANENKFWGIEKHIKYKLKNNRVERKLDSFLINRPTGFHSY